MMKRCKYSFKCYKIDKSNTVEIICGLYLNIDPEKLIGCYGIHLSYYKIERFTSIHQQIMEVRKKIALSLVTHLGNYLIDSLTPISYQEFLFYVNKCAREKEILEILEEYKEKLKINPS